jgi:SAM-dependent methyltransferase
VSGERDVQTEAFFDTHTPEYDAARFASVAEWIRRLAGEGSSLLDVGCGVGNVLAYLRDATGLRRLAGLDVSPRCLERARERVGCETYLGSILDEGVVAAHAGRHDFVVLGAVLHHLVGRTRRASRALALRGMANALALARPGGHVFVLEPVFYPSLVMDVVFYVKRLAVKVTSGRLEIFGQWNNLGAPVVSYYTNEELLGVAGEIPEAEVVELRAAPAHITALQRAALIYRREDTTLVLRRRDPGHASA